MRKVAGNFPMKGRGRKRERERECTCMVGNPIVAVAHGERGEDAAFSRLNNARAGLLCSVCKSALE